MSERKMRCTVCNEHKFQLKMRASKLKPDMPLYLCTRCFEGKYEPRWLIILVSHSRGLESVRDYIVKRKYVGDEIPAVDVLK